MLQVQPLVLEAVEHPGAGGRLGRVELEQEGQVGHERLGGEVIDPLDFLHPQAAGAPLVGQRAVEEAIAHDHQAALERRADHAVHELGASCREEERLGARARREQRVLDQVPDPLAELGPAGLAHADRPVAQRLAEQPRLGGLP